MTGFDLSTRQLAFADRLTTEYGIDAPLVVGDTADLPFAAGAFDLPFVAYAFRWVEDLDAGFGEVVRVLREDGSFVLSLPHPFYGTFDAETGDLARSYFGPGERRTAHEGIGPDQVLYHHRLGEVHGALRDAGFTVERLLEPGTDDPDAYEERWDSKLEPMALVPRTLVVRAVL